MSYARFVIGLLFGICIGLIYPSLPVFWIFVTTLLFLVANEVVGRWGFGSHWAEYRFSSYLLYTGVVVCIDVVSFSSIKTH
jgi:hypothetical protein